MKMETWFGVSDLECHLCSEFHEDILDHIRLIHPDVLVDGLSTTLQASLLSPVTQRMNDDDWVCEDCDKQFRLGMLYGEIFEGMFDTYPLVAFVCGECYMARLNG